MANSSLRIVAELATCTSLQTFFDLSIPYSELRDDYVFTSHKDESTADEQIRLKGRKATISWSDEDEEMEAEGDDEEERVADWDDWLCDAGDMEQTMDSVSSSSTAVATANSPVKQQRHHSSWLHNLLLSYSPAGDVLVLARKDRLAVLEARQVGDDDRIRFFAVCQRSLAGELRKRQEEDVCEISAVYALPLVSSRKTETRPNDWTCVIVGTTTGHLLFLTEKGVLLYRETFSATAVTSIHFAPALHGSQELSVLYEDVLVAIEGLSLLTMLRACRNRVARTGGGATSLQGIADSIDLMFKKWRLAEIRNPCQHACSGPRQPCLFDQYETASISGGYDARINQSQQIYNTYLTVGPSPFVGFSWQVDGAGPTGIRDALFTMADRIKSTVTPSSLFGGFFRGSSSQSSSAAQKRNVPLDVRPVDVAARNVLVDRERQGERVWLATGGSSLAVVADAQARILLVDVLQRRVVRIWKGYRDAECAFIPVVQKRDSLALATESAQPRTLFLAIFAPRRGLIEVWALQNGPRVAAFNVDRRGRLLTTSSQLFLGAVDTSKSADRVTTPSVLFLSANGFFRTINVPFHSSLQDSSSAHAYDESLLKHLDDLLQLASTDALKLQGVTDKLKSVSAKRKALEKVVAVSDCAIVSSLLDHLISAPSRHQSVTETAGESVGVADQLPRRRPNLGRSLSLSVEQRLFRLNCRAIAQLLDLHALLKRHWEERGTAGDRIDVVASANDIADVLLISREELDSDMAILSRYEKRRGQHHIGVSTTEDSEISLPTFCAFLTAFDYSHVGKSIASDDDTTSSNSSSPLWLNFRLHNSAEIDLAATGEFLFGPLLYGYVSLSEYSQSLLPMSGLSPRCLFCLLNAFWLNSSSRSRPTSVYPPTLYALVLLLAKSMQKKAALHTVDRETFQVNPLMSTDGESCFDWVAFLCTEIVMCEQLAEAFALALVVRAVAKRMSERKVEADDSQSAAASGDEMDQSLESNWDAIEFDVEYWDVLIANLRCLTLVGSLPKSTTVGDGPKWPNGISLQKLLQEGRGYYRAELARWAAAFQPNIRDVISAFDSSSVEITTASDDDSWCSLIRALTRRLPLCLRDVESVLCDCAWEQLCWWNRQPDAVETLERTLAFVDLVEHPSLRHGLAYLMWTTFVAGRFTSMCLLVEKVGRPPKERLCRKEADVANAMALCRLADCCRRLLRCLLDANAVQDHAPPALIRYDDHVEQLFQISALSEWSSTSREPLCELVGRQKCTNYFLVLHHFHLATAVFLILENSLKVRPISTLFDDKGRRALWNELHSYPLLPIADVPSTVKAARQTFGENVIAAIAHSAISDYGDSPSISAVMELAKDWELDTDRLRCKQIAEMYSLGVDEAVIERLSSTVHKKGLVLKIILPILGFRIRSFIESSQTPLDRYSTLSKRALTWLKSLPPVVTPSSSADGQSADEFRRMHSHLNSLLATTDDDDDHSENVSLVSDLGELIIMLT